MKVYSLQSGEVRADQTANHVLKQTYNIDLKDPSRGGAYQLVFNPKNYTVVKQWATRKAII